MHSKRILIYILIPDAENRSNFQNFGFLIKIGCLKNIISFNLPIYIKFGFLWFSELLNTNLKLDYEFSIKKKFIYKK